MKRIVAPLLLLAAVVAGCADDSASEAPAATPVSPTPDSRDDGKADAELGQPDALESVTDAGEGEVGDRWAWVEDPNAVISLPEGIGVLKSSTNAFDLYNNQFIAEEVSVACRRLDEGSPESVASGEGFVDYGTDYWSLMVMAAPVGCTEHERAVNRWADRQ